MDKLILHSRFERVRRAYDFTVEQYKNNIDPFKDIPEAFKESENFKKLISEAGPLCNSGAPDVKAYLMPEPGMKHIDIGCGANLVNHHLHRWSSTYYGVDISPKLIQAMKEFINRSHLSIGGLWLAEAADLPFADSSFDISSLIGVLEYCDLDYTEKSLKELHRVLRPGAGLVLDIPNLDHELCRTMFELESYLQRPNIPKERAAFEAILRTIFSIKKVDDSQVMLKYFLSKK